MKRIRDASESPPGVALQCGVFCRTRRQIFDWCSTVTRCCVKHLPVITSTDKTYILFVVTYGAISQIKMTEFRSIDFWVWLMFVSFWDRKMCQSRDFVIPPPSCYCCTSCSKKTKRPNEFYSTFCSGKHVYGLMVQLHTLLNWSHSWQTRWVMIIMAIYVIWPK